MDFDPPELLSASNYGSDDLGAPADASPAPAKRPRNHRVVVEAPTLDLDAYIAQYRGRTKIERLLFIAQRCPPLAADAYRLALRLLADDTLDVPLYTAALQRYNQLLDDRRQPGVAPDAEWLESAGRAARVEAEKLENELKTYRANSIKESIRMGYNDLGEHYFRCGNLNEAVKNFVRAREYATNPKNSIHHTIHLMQCHLLLNQHTQVRLNLSKLQSLVDEKNPDPATLALSRVFQALVHLKDANYRAAAHALLQLTLADCADNIEDVLSPNDVALIVAHCALAAFSRDEIKRSVLDADGFRAFLDLEPHARHALAAFHGAKYAACLATLARHRDDRLLDPYLAPHVETLLLRARHRALAAYVAPYSTVDLDRMARAFACDGAALEAEVRDLIAGGTVAMKIDARARTLVARTADARARAFGRAADAGDALEVTRSQAMLKMALVHAELAVRGSPGGERGDSVSPGSAMGAYAAATEEYMAAAGGRGAAVRSTRRGTGERDASDRDRPGMMLRGGLAGLFSAGGLYKDPERK